MLIFWLLLPFLSSIFLKLVFLNTASNACRSLRSKSEGMPSVIVGTMKSEDKSQLLHAWEDSFSRRFVTYGNETSLNAQLNLHRQADSLWIPSMDSSIWCVFWRCEWGRCWHWMQDKAVCFLQNWFAWQCILLRHFQSI